MSICSSLSSVLRDGCSERGGGKVHHVRVEVNLEALGSGGDEIEGPSRRTLWIGLDWIGLDVFKR